MMPKFTNSISLSMNSRRREKVVGHVRSSSLPCQLHPLIANLEGSIEHVRSWTAGRDVSFDSIESGLSQIEHLVTAINDFLKLSDIQTKLQYASSFTEYLLECFLCLIDSYGSLLSNLVALKQHQFEVQSALRTHDSTLLASSLKSQRRIQKDLSHLAISLRATSKCMSSVLGSDASETDTSDISKEAIGVLTEASMILFNKVVAMSATAYTTATSSALFNVRHFKKKSFNNEAEISIHVKLEELEENIKFIEGGSERVLRELVNCRVALLNIQSNSF